MPAIAGIPLTHRGLATTFTVVTGHDQIQSLGGGRDHTVVLLMGIGTLANSAITLARGERGGECPVAIIEDGYGPGQRVTVGTLDTIALQAARRGIRSPAVVVVGDVVTLSPYAPEAIGGHAEAPRHARLNPETPVHPPKGPAAMTRPLRVAIVGAGPAGIYAGNILNRQVTEAGGEVAIDLFESLPAPYGLIRYGVAPDHPRIKGIVNSLHEMLDAGTIRLIGNVEVGRDVSVDELRERYDAVVFATGALRDAPLDIPGIDLPGSYGAADLVAWYDGHPDVPRDWPLEAEQIAVIGNGNVALDVARVLAKHPKDLLSTDVPANVVAGLEASPVTDVHVFGRRGPTHVKFTPIELRELGEVPDVDVIVYDDDFERAAGDPHADQLLASNNQVKVMTRTLNGWRKPADWRPTASRRLHLHFLHTPGRGARLRSRRGRAVRAHASGGRRLRRGHRRVRRRARAGGLPRGRLRELAAAGRAVRRARGRDPERRRPGHGCRGRAASRASTPPAGSSAAPSASSATPRATPSRPSPTCSRMPRRARCPHRSSRRGPTATRCSSCSRPAASASRPGPDGWSSTRTSAGSARRGSRRMPRTPTSCASA